MKAPQNDKFWPFIRNNTQILKLEYFVNVLRFYTKHIFIQVFHFVFIEGYYNVSVLR